MTLGDLQDFHLQPPAYGDELSPQIEKMLDLADDAQSIWPGSRVEIVVHVPSEDHLWRDGAEVTDAPKRYSVKLAKRVS